MIPSTNSLYKAFSCDYTRSCNTYGNVLQTYLTSRFYLKDPHMHVARHLTKVNGSSWTTSPVQDAELHDLSSLLWEWCYFIQKLLNLINIVLAWTLVLTDVRKVKTHPKKLVKVVDMNHCSVVEHSLFLNFLHWLIRAPTWIIRDPKFIIP